MFASCMLSRVNEVLQTSDMRWRIEYYWVNKTQKKTNC